MLTAIEVSPGALEEHSDVVLPGALESIRPDAATLAWPREPLLPLPYLKDYVGMVATLAGLRPTERD